MRHIVFLLLIILFTETTAQQLTVLDSEATIYLKGRKIKKGDKISLSKKIKINHGGHLGLEYGRWSFYLKPGTYSMDSVFRGQIHSRQFIVDDSIYTILKTENLLKCQKTGIQCMDVNQLVNPNYKKKNNSITAISDSIVLKWDDRLEYDGNYYVVFTNLFGEFIYIDRTTKKEMDFNLRPFKNEKAIMYKVVSQDCIESDLMVIRIE